MAGQTRAVARLVTLVLGAILFGMLAPASAHVALLDEEQFEGRVPTAEELVPSVEAAFARESYAPGSSARLVFFNASRGVSLQIFQSGPEHVPTVGENELEGVPLTGPAHVGRTRPGSSYIVHVGAWPSGLYFARLAARDGPSDSRRSSFIRPASARATSRSSCPR